ncbi:hypothetical protein DFJ73DRAFT_875722 [Zopfochytrium polystomum]|nr:hypothetical protein DFJ73DRAFT_875722 [Zopfochytrium polystomum]
MEGEPPAHPPPPDLDVSSWPRRSAHVNDLPGHLLLAIFHFLQPALPYSLLEPLAPAGDRWAQLPVRAVRWQVPVYSSAYPSSAHNSQGSFYHSRHLGSLLTTTKFGQRAAAWRRSIPVELLLGSVCKRWRLVSFGMGFSGSLNVAGLLSPARLVRLGLTDGGCDEGLITFASDIERMRHLKSLDLSFPGVSMKALKFLLGILLNVYLESVRLGLSVSPLQSLHLTFRNPEWLESPSGLEPKRTVSLVLTDLANFFEQVNALAQFLKVEPSMFVKVEAARIHVNGKFALTPTPSRLLHPETEEQPSPMHVRIYQLTERKVDRLLQNGSVFVDSRNEPLFSSSPRSFVSSLSGPVPPAPPPPPLPMQEEMLTPRVVHRFATALGGHLRTLQIRMDGGIGRANGMWGVPERTMRPFAFPWPVVFPATVGTTLVGATGNGAATATMEGQALNVALNGGDWDDVDPRLIPNPSEEMTDIEDSEAEPMDTDGSPPSETNATTSAENSSDGNTIQAQEAQSVASTSSPTRGPRYRLGESPPKRTKRRARRTVRGFQSPSDDSRSARSEAWHSLDLPRQHPAMTFALYHPSLTTLRMDAYPLNLPVLRDLLPNLRNLHVRDVYHTMGSLEGFDQLEGLSLGVGNWPPGEGFPGFGGSQPLFGRQGNNPVARGMRPSSPAGAGPNDVGMAVLAPRHPIRSLLGSLPLTARRKMRTLAIGAISLEGFLEFFVGKGEALTMALAGNVSVWLQDEVTKLIDDSTASSAGRIRRVDESEGGSVDAAEEAFAAEDENTALENAVGLLSSSQSTGFITDFAAIESASDQPNTLFGRIANALASDAAGSGTAGPQMEVHPRDFPASAQPGLPAVLKSPPVPLLPQPLSLLTKLWARVIPHLTTEHLRIIFKQCPMLRRCYLTLAGPLVVGDMLRLVREVSIARRTAESIRFRHKGLSSRRRGKERAVSATAHTSDHRIKPMEHTGASDSNTNQDGQTEEEAESSSVPGHLRLWLWLADRDFDDAKAERAALEELLLDTSKHVSVQFFSDVMG